MEIFGQPVTVIELSGTLFGIAGVLFTVQKNILCFPAGLVNVTLYAWLFFKSHLYADALLQIFYIVLLVFGWIEWGKNSSRDFIPEKTTTKTMTRLALIVAGASILIGALMKQFTSASVPYLDSTLASASLAAQWLVAKKKIENWVVWIVADVLYIGMYIYKQLYLTSVLYFIFILLAFMGYYGWKKKIANASAG